MKKVLVVALIGVGLSGCGRNNVEPNREGVLMENYGRNGRSDFKAVTGTQGVLGPGSELYQVPMWDLKADPAAMKISVKGGGDFTVDPTYSYKAIRGSGVDIVFNYKHIGLLQGGMDNIEDQVLNPLVLNAYREEARTYSADSLLKNPAAFERQVEARLSKEFQAKFFTLGPLSSGLKPPQSMIDAIERRNNAIQQAELVQNELAVSEMLLKKARIDAEANRVRSGGLTKEVLQQQWIEAIKTTSNKVIITDGRTPLMLTQ